MHPAAWTYILTNSLRHTMLYVGSTVDLSIRLWEHRTKRRPKSFTARYNIFKLVYYEECDCIEEALNTERYIKGKTRKWKEELINSVNPEWRDLTEEIMARYG